MIIRFIAFKLKYAQLIRYFNGLRDTQGIPMQNMENSLNDGLN